MTAVGPLVKPGESEEIDQRLRVFCAQTQNALDQ